MECFDTNAPVLRAIHQENDQPQRPTAVRRIVNNREDTLQLEAGDHTFDLCYLYRSEDLVISLSDQNGNQVAAVKISPEFLQNYLNRIAAGAPKSA